MLLNTNYNLNRYRALIVYINRGWPVSQLERDRIKMSCARICL